MKKVLLATTMLVGTAGFAIAQDTGVSLTGSAEMGIAGNSGEPVRFHTDWNVQFGMSAETDSGLTFGASIGLDDAIGAGGDATDNDDEEGGATVFVNSAYGNLTMGDTDGALDWAVTEVGIGSALRDDHTSHAGYSGNGGFDLTDSLFPSVGLDGFLDGQVARYDYSFGDFGLAVSAEVPDTNEPFAFGPALWEANAVLGLGARYAANGLSLGFGYQWTDVDSLTVGVDDLGVDSYVLSAGYAVNGFDMRANIGRTSTDGPFDVDVDHIGLGVGYTMGDLLIAANWGEFTRSESGFDDVTRSGYGLVANYDLGAGASAQFGYAESNFDGAATDEDFSTFSAGVALTF